jgi:serine/threonine protein kinase
VLDEPDSFSGDSDAFELANRIDIICDAYEQSWRSGANPNLSSFILGFDGEPLNSLVTQLLLLDCELRAERGEATSREHYLLRFSEFRTLINGIDFLTSIPPKPITPVVSSNERYAHFELLERLGEGTSGTVWKARDTQLRRFVALKIPHWQSMTEAEQARFRREGQACAQLHHPNIVAVYQVGDQHGRFYISNELIEGCNLRDWISEQRRLSYVEIVRLIAELADALQHAHEQGVIHRDLKPANVLIDPMGKPHLTDFGLARWTDQSVALTIEGHVVGTPAYMSPEQARGDTISADARTDIYGLGAIFYELLTGRPPFEGDLSSVIQNVINHDPMTPAKVDVKIPRDLDTICLRAMQKAPVDRYPSMQSLSDDLRRFLGGEPIAARRTSFLSRSIRFVKRHKTLSGMIAACILAIGALGAVAILAERNYQLQGFRSVSMTTDPPGARVAFVPLSTETFEPELHRKVLAPGHTPVEIDLLPGDYFVGVVMADGRFHEVYRRVPKVHQQLRQHHDLNAILLDDGTVKLYGIKIPDEDITRQMTRIKGTPSFPFASVTTKTAPYTLPILPFWIDNHEFTVQEHRALLTDTSATEPLNNRLPDTAAQPLGFDAAVFRAEALGKRLPTEAEYEFVATNGGSTKYPWGNDWPVDADLLVSSEGSDPFGPVGIPAFDKVAKYPEVVGLCSNKAEWVIPQLRPKVFDPLIRPAITLDLQVYRGGNAATIAGDPRVTAIDRDPRLRNEAPGKLEYIGLGLRCVRSAEPLVGYDEFQ